MDFVERLETLASRLESGGLRSLTDEELLDLGRCYRRTGALLGRLRTAGLEGPRTDRLNRLLARVYPRIHAPPPRPRLLSVREFLAVEFPRAIRRESPYVLAAVAMLLAGALLGALLVEMNPEAPDLLFGPGWREGLQSIAERHEGQQDWLPAAIRPAASAGIMVNNIKVSFAAFASGVLWCVGSLYILGFNGLLLGAVGVVVHHHGTSLDFWAFVAPHGVTELTAIMLAGGAGLVMGWALVSPGRLHRVDALRLAARRAVPLLMGVVVMLVLAGIIEGFFSPVPEVPAAVKLGFAALTAVCLVLWFGLAGRAGSARRDPIDG